MPPAKVIRLPFQDDLASRQPVYLPPRLKQPTEEWIAQRFSTVLAGEQARAELIEAHKRMAECLADKFANRHHLEPRMAEGARGEAYKGLINALDRFDPGKGFKFSTFATVTINGTLMHWLRDKCFFNLLKRRDMDLMSAANKVKKRLEDASGEKAGLRLVADELAQGAYARQGADKIFRQLLEIEHKLSLVPLDKPVIGNEGALTSFADFLPAQNSGTASIEDSLALFSDRSMVEKLMAALGEEERTVIELYYLRGLSQAAIGRELDCSAMKVSNLRRRALARMRAVAKRLEKEFPGMREALLSD